MPSVSLIPKASLFQNLDWAKREAEMRDLLSKGIIPQVHDAQQAREKGEQRKQSEALKKERAAVKEGHL